MLENNNFSYERFLNFRLIFVGLDINKNFSFCIFEFYRFFFFSILKKKKTVEFFSNLKIVFFLEKKATSFVKLISKCLEK